MASVTSIIKKTRQPEGGYLPKSLFKEEQYEDEFPDLPKEVFNISPGLIGVASDYLVRTISLCDGEKGFRFSIMGAKLIGEEDKAREMAKSVWTKFMGGEGREAAKIACQLAGYDVCYRSSPRYYKPVEDIQPNEITVSEVVVFMCRTRKFLGGLMNEGTKYWMGMTFPGAYNKTVSAGDADYIFGNTLIDLKTSEQGLSIRDTLQLAMYYQLAEHMKKKTWELDKLCVFNARLNRSYTLDLADVPDETFERIAHEVMGYED